jgi:dTDP-4-dehydrorhamnose reductase
MNKKVIIGTGLSGLLGSRVQELLGDAYTWHDFSRSKGHDITDADHVESFLKETDFDMVVNFAAFTDVNASWNEYGDEEGMCYRLNVGGVKNLVKTCSQLNKHLVQISTEFVFDGTKEGTYTEEDEMNGLDWYAKTKMLAEKEIMAGSMPYTILRPSFPFRSKFETKSDIIRKTLKGISENTLFPMFTDSIMTPTFIDDFAFALDHFLKTGTKGTFNTTGSTSLSPYDMAREVAIVFGFDPDSIKKGSMTEYLKTAKHSSPRNLRVSNQKLKDECGVLMHTLHDALEIVKKQLSDQRA